MTPADTPLAAHLKAGKPKFAPVEVSDATIGRVVAVSSAVAPKLCLIMVVIHRLPRFVFNKMDI